MKQRIYEVKYEVTLYVNDEANDKESDTIKIAAQSIGEAISKALPYAKENHQNLAPHFETGDDGEKIRYQWKDFDVLSCNLLMETDA